MKRQSSFVPSARHSNSVTREFLVEDTIRVHFEEKLEPYWEELVREATRNDHL